MTHHSLKRDIGTYIIFLIFMGLMVLLIVVKYPEPQAEEVPATLIPPLVLECDRHVDTLCVEYHEVEP